MRATKRIAIMICCCMIALVFTACGSAETKKTEDDPRAQFAGEYTYTCIDISDYHVYLEPMKGTTTTLNADGTGSLYWGEENQGPISEWTVDDASAGKITIKAGVSTMSGTVKDGILRIEMNESFAPVYALEGADTSAIKLVTPDELPDDILEQLMGS